MNNELTQKMPTAVVRTANQGDLPAIVALLEKEGLPTSDIGNHIHLYLMEQDGEALAIGGWEEYETIGLLRSVLTASHIRGKGLGRSWVQSLLDEASQKGLTDFYLLTETAAPFFEKMGFISIDRASVPSVIQTTTEFSSLCPSSAVVMHRTLSA